MNIRGVCLYVWWWWGGGLDCNVVYLLMCLFVLFLVSEDLSILCFFNEV